MRDSRNLDMTRSFMRTQNQDPDAWKQANFLMQSMHFERAKNNANNHASYYSSSNPSFDSHKAKLNQSDFVSKMYTNYNDKATRNSGSFLKDAPTQRMSDFHERMLPSNFDFMRKGEMHLRQSGKDFFKKRGSNLDKMKRDVRRFETELVKAKQFLHGKKQSSFNDSRVRKKDSGDRLRSSIYEKQRRSRRPKKELEVAGKTSRGVSRSKHFERYRAQHSILGDRIGRDSAKAAWKKKTRTARTMEKRRGRRGFFGDEDTHFSNRNIAKLPRLGKDLLVGQSGRKPRPKDLKKEDWKPGRKNVKEIKLEDLYSKNLKKGRNRSRTPVRRPRKSEMISKKEPLPKVPRMDQVNPRKGSFITATIKEKNRGIVHTRKLLKQKEKMRSRPSFQEAAPAPEAEVQNSVGPYHSSKTENGVDKFDARPKIMLKFAVVNGLEHGREKTGQDAVLVYKFKVKREQFHVFGVFDGHGKHGHHVSLFLKKNLVPVLKQEILEFRAVKGMKEIIRDAIKTLHERIFEITKNFQQNYSNK